MSWIAVLLGAVGFVAALVAIRRGWQPSPKRLIAGSVLAVLALMLTIPVGSGDPLYYVAYGRIATLGHSVYASAPNQFLSARDPDAAAVRQYVPLPPSRYGPVQTLYEEAASAIAGDSPARNLFWLKVWNAVAYLALVFVLDRLMRPDRMRRVRAHLMWSLNPLMLYLIMADGHNDVLAVVMGQPRFLPSGNQLHATPSWLEYCWFWQLPSRPRMRYSGLARCGRCDVVRVLSARWQPVLQRYSSPPTFSAAGEWLRPPLSASWTAVRTQISSIMNWPALPGMPTLSR
jgi:hypothetical protein